MLIGVDIFSMGFSELLHGRPCRETLVSVAIIAAILHSVSLIVFPEQNGVTTPYIAATILLLYAMMREDRARYAARSRSYKAVAQADRPVAVYSHYDEVDDACRAAKGPLFNKNDFLTELERPDTVDRFSMIYAPLALALSIILALVSSLGRGEPVRFFWAFSAVTAVAAPIGLLCAFGAGYKNIARRLLASGAAIAGARQANLLRGTEEVVLAENDLFPTGSIELESIKAVGQMSRGAHSFVRNLAHDRRRSGAWPHAGRRRASARHRAAERTRTSAPLRAALPATSAAAMSYSARVRSW